MKKIITGYLLINLVLATIFFVLINFFQWSTVFKDYGFSSYLIIALSSLLVFFGVFGILKLDPGKMFVSYLFFTLIKNAVLLYYCYEYRQITGILIFYLLFIYIMLMITEVLFILKLSKCKSSEKNKKT